MGKALTAFISWAQHHQRSLRCSRSRKVAVLAASLCPALLVLLVGGLSSSFADPVTVSFQDGANGYSGTRDTTLASSAPSTNYGSSGKLEVDGSPDLSCLIFWDLTSIPPGSFVQSADVVVNVTNTSTERYEIYEVLRPWVENEATWTQYRLGQNWQAAGANGPADRGSTVLGELTASSSGSLVIPLNASGIPVVQSWVDSPGTNHGFIVMDYINNRNGLDFSSRETATVPNRPKLIVTYESNSQPVLSIHDVIVTEGDTGTVEAVFTISLSRIAADVVTVDYDTADGSATAGGNDYVAAFGQVSFQPGETSQSVTVEVNGDVADEGDEYFFVRLSNALNAGIGDYQGICTISDDDGPLLPDIKANPMSHNFGYVPVGEGSNHLFAVTNEGTGNLNVSSTTLNGADAGDFRIDSGGGPFTLAPGEVQNIDVWFAPISAGAKYAILQIASDDPDEGLLEISLVGNDISGSLPGEVTFTVTGDYPSVAEMPIFQTHMNEHNLYSPSEFFVHVGDVIDQSDGCHPASYQNVANLLKTLAVPAFVVIGDNDWMDCADPDQGFAWWMETFEYFEENFCGALAVERQNVRIENWAFVMKGVLFVGINNPGTSDGSGEREIRLQDDADWVQFQFQDKGDQIRAAVVFGHAGPSSSERLFFDQFVASSRTFAKPVFYIQGHDHNFLLDNPWPEPNMQRLTVPRGAEEDPLQITVTMDVNHPFSIVRNPWNNNPQLFNRIPCVEAGPSQIMSQNETLQLSGAAKDDGVPTNPGNLTIAWRKVEGPGEVVFGNADSLSTSANFSSEGFYRLLLTADDGELSNSDEVIVEVTSAIPSLAIDDISIDEGNAGSINAVFTVTLAIASGQTVTVDFATADGSATTANNDYVGVSGQLSFLPGETSKTLTVVVNGDVIFEPNETFAVNLSNAGNATIGDSQGIATIVNDDAQPPSSSLTISDVTVTEGNSGSINAAFTVTLTPASSQTVTVNYATADGSATTSDNDYQAISGLLTFEPNETSKPVTVVVNGDLIYEPNETFAVNLSNAVNATISDNQGIGSIVNDDVQPPPSSLSISDVTVTEGDTGTNNAVFTVALAPASGQTVTVDFTTADGSATTANNDYVGVSGQLSFLPGETSKFVTVVVNGDVILEPNETFVVNLTNPVNATIGNNQGMGTISNDDSVQEPVTISFQDGVDGYAGTRDTKLMSSTPGVNFGSDTTLEVDGSPDISSLLHWDLSGIPSGSIIQSVTITVNITNASAHIYDFFQLLRPWVEPQATWNSYASGLSWQGLGANGSGDRGMTALGSITGSKGSATIPLNAWGVNVVQSWVDHPESNHGFIVLNYTSASDGLDFSSRENGTVSRRPKLTITYR